MTGKDLFRAAFCTAGLVVLACLPGGVSARGRKYFMKKTLRFLLSLLVLFTALGFVSCDGIQEKTVETVYYLYSSGIRGTWHTGENAKLVLTETEYISYYNNSVSYKADIVFESTGWNGGEYPSDKSLPNGYMVIKFTQAPSWNAGIADKYMVVRWKQVKTASDGKVTMSYSEGYKGMSDYFDTAEDAIVGATGEAKYFNNFSTATLIFK